LRPPWPGLPPSYLYFPTIAGITGARHQAQPLVEMGQGEGLMNSTATLQISASGVGRIISLKHCCQVGMIILNLTKLKMLNVLRVFSTPSPHPGVFLSSWTHADSQDYHRPHFLPDCLQGNIGNLLSRDSAIVHDSDSDILIWGLLSPHMTQLKV
jgi:hypothetical protein